MFRSSFHPFIILFLLTTLYAPSLYAQDIEVDFSDVSGVPGETVVLPLSADFDAIDGEVLSYDFKLTYDAAKVIVTAIEDPNNRFDNFLRNLTKSEDGEVTFAAASVAGAESGLLAEITITLRDYTDPTMPLTLTGSFGAITDDGEVYVPVNLVSTVTIAEPNEAPEAADDQAQTTQGESILIDVLENDTDPDGYDLEITAVTEPSNGTAAIEESMIRYTPDAEFLGQDSFIYTISDGRGGESSATVTVTVTEAPNLPPQFPANMFIQPADGESITVGGSVNDPGDPTLMIVFEWNAATDPEGDEITYRWEISNDDSFESTINSMTTTSTSIEFSHAAVAAWLDELAVPAHGSAQLYQRVVASDGTNDTVGSTASVTITRGVFVNSEDGIAHTFSLSQNYPNPFNPSTTIEYSVPSPGHVTLSVFDALGKEVARLVDGPQAAGTRVVRFDASELSSGIYVYRLSTGDHAMSRSMLLVK